MRIGIAGVCLGISTWAFLNWLALSDYHTNTIVGSTVATCWCYYWYEKEEE